jgi:5-methylcytosine-specific restriction endonuclease McrA
MRIENSKCLVLNADYSVLGIVDWKKALTWLFKYGDVKHPSIEIIDFYKDDFIQGVNNKKFPIPAVIKTSKYFRLQDCRVNFSRKNLFIRDNYSCQYCGIQEDINNLTYDHVIPKSSWKGKMGSPTCWTNIVTACVTCNRKKGNRTPQQANMPLKNLPISPKKSSRYLPITHFLVKIRSEIPSEWAIYLPESYL